MKLSKKFVQVLQYIFCTVFVKAITVFFHFSLTFRGRVREEADDVEDSEAAEGEADEPTVEAVEGEAETSENRRHGYLCP